MNTLQWFWESFSTQVINKNAPDVQRIEMKRAFYAGCQTVLSLTFAIGDESVSKDAGVQMLEHWHQEAAMFLESLKNGTD